MILRSHSLSNERGYRPSRIWPFESRIAGVDVQQGQDEVVSLSLSTRLPKPADIGCVVTDLRFGDERSNSCPGVCHGSYWDSDSRY